MSTQRPPSKIQNDEQGYEKALAAVGDSLKSFDFDYLESRLHAHPQRHVRHALAPRRVEGPRRGQGGAQGPLHRRLQLVSFPPGYDSDSVLSYVCCCSRLSTDRDVARDSGVKHFEEIREAGLELPDINQIEVSTLHFVY